MNPKIKYEFRSHTGQLVTITSRLGEDAARTAAMLHLWGPPSGWCQNMGLGLDLLGQHEEPDGR